MSLVNDILKELEKEVATKQEHALPHQEMLTKTKRHSPQSGQWVLWFCSLVILMCLSIICWLYYKKNHLDVYSPASSKAELKQSIIVRSLPDPTHTSVQKAQLKPTIAQPVRLTKQSISSPQSLALPEHPTHGQLMRALAHDLDLLYGLQLYDRDMAGQLVLPRRPTKIHNVRVSAPITLESPKETAISFQPSDEMAAPADTRQTRQRQKSIAETWLDVDSNSIPDAAWDQRRDSVDMSENMRAQKIIRAAQEENTERFDSLLMPLLLKENKAATISVLLQALENHDKTLIARRTVQFYLKHISRHEYSIFKVAARFYMSQGETLKALSILERANPVIDTHPDYYSLKAYSFLKLRNYESSIALYKELLSLDPDQPNWWLGLAVSYQANKMTTPALKAYRMALQKSPSRSSYRYYIKDKISELVNLS